jgi:sugar lactone lactonase YvrE
MALHPEDLAMGQMSAAKPRRTPAIFLFTLISGLTLLLTAGIVFSAPQTGDLIVTAGGTVMCVDPITGDIEIISSGDLMNSSRGLVIASSGDIYATSRKFQDGFNGVVKIDPITGDQTPISQDGLLTGPQGIAFDNQGMLVVADVFDRVVTVDPTTGAQTLISSSGLIQVPRGIVVEEDGSIVVTSTQVQQSPTRQGIVRINPTDGSQSIVTIGNTASDKFYGLEIAASGDFYVGNHTNNGFVLLVDRDTGDQTVVSLGGDLTYVYDLALAGPTDLFVIDKHPVGFGYVIHVDPMSGEQTRIAESGMDGLLSYGRGIAIFPDTNVQTVTTTWGQLKSRYR